MPKKKKKPGAEHLSGTHVKAASKPQKDEAMFSGSAIVLVLSLFIIHPLAFGFGGYVTIESVKFNIFFAIWAYSILVIALAAAVTKIQKPDFLKWRGTKALLHAIRPYEYAMLGYWLVMLVSAFLSKYPGVAFGGINSRGESLFLQTAYLLTAAVAARLYVLKEKHILIFCAVASLISLYGVCMFYGFDFLGFNITEDLSWNVGPGLLFMSTVSNRIVAAVYFCSAFCISAVMFARCESRLRWAYLAAGLVIFYALLVCNSRGAYIGLLFAAALAFPFIAKTRRHTAGFMFMLSGCAALCWVFGKSYGHFGYGAPPFDALTPFFPWLALLLAALGAFFLFSPLPALSRKVIISGWYLLLVAAIAAGAASLPVIAERTGNNTIRQASEILKGNIDETFGTNRIFV